MKDLTKEIEDNVKEENPFVTSEQFVHLVRSHAQLARVILLKSQGPHEAVNAILSLIVTFLKNIPDKVWEMIQKQCQSEGNKDNVSAHMITLLEVIRNYQGGHYVSWSEEPDGDMPAVNTRMPKKPI